MNRNGSAAVPNFGRGFSCAECGGGKAEVSYEEALGKANDCSAQLISTKQAA